MPDRIRKTHVLPSIFEIDRLFEESNRPGEDQNHHCPDGSRQVGVHVSYSNLRKHRRKSGEKCREQSPREPVHNPLNRAHVPRPARDAKHCACDQRGRIAFTQEASAAIPLSSRYCSSVNCSAAACTFSARCASEDVPGMGSITGDRFSNHPSATWIALTPCAFAILSSSLPATFPAPRG